MLLLMPRPCNTSTMAGDSGSLVREMNPILAVESIVRKRDVLRMDRGGHGKAGNNHGQKRLHGSRVCHHGLNASIP